MQRKRQVAVALAAVGLLGLTLTPGCKVGYLMKSGYYQAELLSSREPVTELREQGLLTAEEMARLDLIADIKAYGAEIGLSATDNYDTLAWEWDRTIWNVSGCEPLAFEPKTWWFPIVGRFPYLGFFREQDARTLESQLSDDGYDVYVRTAGAYSTLGWFKDPILPGMLLWSDYGLADTVLHELAHATLWVPGSVDFNESYANFVGQVAAMRYLQDRRGTHSPELLEAVLWKSDSAKWRALQHELYADLDAVYLDASLSEADKLAEKERLFGPELRARVEAAGFARPERYLLAVDEGVWNNARLIQFKTYNTNEQLFTAILVDEDGDLLAFIDRIGEITDKQPDPWVALQAYVDALEPSGAPGVKKSQE